MNTKEIKDYSNKYQKLKVNKDIIQDAINIANGVYAPLSGFLHKDDFQSVLDRMRLTNGALWSMPIVLSINNDEYAKLKNEKALVLIDDRGKPKVILENIEVYTYNKNEMAKKVYGTLDNNHPGVAEIMRIGNYLVGGKIKYVDDSEKIFPEHNFTPAETKKIFIDKGWKTIAAFQTRNVPHRAHEYLQKETLKKVDGLLVQPVIGEKKEKDFKDEYIISAYEILIDRYFPKDKVLLSILPLKMRYAGPREALMHALIRRNFGCTHFIVGRDHAGVGNFYHPEAAHKIFDNFSKKELGIKILKFPEVVYNKLNKKYCFINECVPNNALNFSGTELRESIKNRQRPPLYVIRPEVYHFLTCSYNTLVDDIYKNKKNHKGFVLWFTGLSASGKSTIADMIYKELVSKDMKIERLDGDAVRESLTRDLGFTKEDRDENIRRVGLVAKLLSRNGIGVVASFISPYRKVRQELRRNIENFIEVFVDTPLEVCESRDVKGLYARARKGEITNFTGISDPYERPDNPDIHLKADNMSAQECIDNILVYLKKNGCIK